METQVPVLNTFAGALYDLIKASLLIDPHVTPALCLQVLINLTYDSPNTSIYLTSKHGFVTTLMALMDDDKLAQDVIWLLVHIQTDSVVGLSSLQKATIFDLFS